MTDRVGTYRIVPGWGRGPDAPPWGLVSGVATDSRDRVYVFLRVPRAVMVVYDRDGRYLRTWDYGFVQPHAIWIGPDDRVFLTDTGDHTVRVFTTEGALVQTFGTPGQPGAPGRPFNRPTRAVVGPSGAIYVTDGYGQDYVHKLAPDGRLIRTWGGHGAAPGQLHTPHSLWVDRRERVYVLDRQNDRVQVFDGDGAFLCQWTGFTWPHDIFITADELVVTCECAPRVPGSTIPYYQTMKPQPIGVFTTEGEPLGRWGQTGTAPGQFADCPHSLWIDSRGDVYVGEVVTHDRLQKFERVD